MLGADVHAAVAEDALRPIEDRVDLALQAAQAFGAPLGLVKTQFHLRDADAAVGGQDRHRLARGAQVIRAASASC